MAIARKSPAEENPSISFPDWKEVLEDSDLSAADRQAFASEIIRFLRHCSVHHTPASVAVARIYLEQQRDESRDCARLALRWFVKAARNSRSTASESATGGTAAEPTHGGAMGDPMGESDQRTHRQWATDDDSSRPDEASSSEWSRTESDPSVQHSRSRPVVPPVAAADLGGANWERDLIRAIRRKGFLWRTEQTYRAWAARFAAPDRSANGLLRPATSHARREKRFSLRGRVSRIRTSRKMEGFERASDGIPLQRLRIYWPWEPAGQVGWLIRRCLFGPTMCDCFFCEIAGTGTCPPTLRDGVQFGVLGFGVLEFDDSLQFVFFTK